MKHVKGSLKLWHREFKEAKICTRKKLCEDILLIEKKMDDQMANVEEVQNRAVWIKELAELDRIDVLDCKWFRELCMMANGVRFLRL